MKSWPGKVKRFGLGNGVQSVQKMTVYAAQSKATVASIDHLQLPNYHANAAIWDLNARGHLHDPCLG